MPGVGVGPGLGPPWRRQRKANGLEQALALLKGVKTFALVVSNSIKVVGEKVIGFVSNFKV